MLRAPVEHHLQPYANAQHRPRAGKPLTDDARPVYRPQPPHAGVEGAHPGHEEAVGLDGLLRVAGDGDLGADVFEGALRRAQVTGPVIEQGNVGAGSGRACHHGWLV